MLLADGDDTRTRKSYGGQLLLLLKAMIRKRITNISHRHRIDLIQFQLENSSSLMMIDRQEEEEEKKSERVTMTHDSMDIHFKSAWTENSMLIEDR